MVPFAFPASDIKLAGLLQTSNTCLLTEGTKERNHCSWWVAHPLSPSALAEPEGGEDWEREGTLRVSNEGLRENHLESFAFSPRMYICVFFNKTITITTTSDQSLHLILGTSGFINTQVSQQLLLRVVKGCSQCFAQSFCAESYFFSSG